MLHNQDSKSKGETKPRESKNPGYKLKGKTSNAAFPVNTPEYELFSQLSCE
jgi:hypothetical protein